MMLTPTFHHYAFPPILLIQSDNAGQTTIVNAVFQDKLVLPKLAKFTQVVEERQVSPGMKALDLFFLCMLIRSGEERPV